MTHSLTISRPLYNQGKAQASCSCGWTGEHPTAGQACLAGLGHIRETEKTKETTP